MGSITFTSASDSNAKITRTYTDPVITNGIGAPNNELI